MKAIKIYLIIVTTLLALALAAGVYVWYVIQQTQVQIDQELETPPTATEQSETPVEQDVQEPITIDVSELSETQQKTLQTFGFEGETFVVTPTMITCAENAVGNERFDAIIGGASPSPLESLKLLPCFKK